MFIGRTAELQLFERAYASNKGELAVVYGRRRIGKSALINRFLHGKRKAFSIEALENSNTQEQLAHFARRLGEYLKEPQLSRTVFEDWDQAFGYFTRNALADSGESGKQVLFIDELQWMAVGKGALVSVLKYYWDNHWKQRNVMLILCGSISSFMIRKVIRSKALYGRTTLELNLKGLQPFDAHTLLGKDRPVEEVMKYLLVFGTVPKYLEGIDVGHSFNENMNTICFSKDGSLVNEVGKIFHSQFRKPETYFRIIRFLTNRISSTRELSALAGIKSGGGLSGYIDNLVNADLIMPFASFDKKNGDKSLKYTVCDEFLHFYQKYMKPNLRLIEQSRSSRTFENVTDAGFDSWLGVAFERFCHKHAGLLAQKMGFADQMLQAAPLFDKNDEWFQIDLLYRRSDKIIVVCEIKHSINEVSTAVIPEVQRKCDLLKIPRGFAVQKALISLYGPDKALADSRYFNHSLTAADVLAE